MDRVVASISDEAVTESDVNQEYRLEQFLAGRTPADPPDARTFEGARDRLVEQRLLSEEAANETVSAQEISAAAEKRLGEAEKLFASPQDHQSAFRALGMDEAEVLARLRQQETVLAMIDHRLRPQAWVEPAEIEAYYRGPFAAEAKERGAGKLPPLSEVETQIREILTEKKIDGLLAQWVEELKTSRRVVLHSF